MPREERRGNRNKKENSRQEHQREHGNRINLGEIVDSAVNEGIGAIVEAHPRFKGQENFMLNYIDHKNLNKYLAEEVKKIQKGEYKNKEAAEEAFKEKFANYVASGELFNEKGKEFILRKSLGKESRSWWSGGWAREIREGENYLDKTFNAFNDLYNLIKTGDYAKKMPKLAKAIEQIDSARFTNAAFDILYERGVVNKNNYRAIKSAIVKGVKELSDYSYKTLESQIPQKAAASIMALAGLGVLLTSNKITGAVIGNSSVSSIPALIFGIAALIAGIYLFVKLKKKT